MHPPCQKGYPQHSLPIVEPLLVRFTLDYAIPAADIFAIVLVDSSIGEARIFVAIEFEYCIIHQTCV